MSASNAIGNFNLDAIQLRKPLSTTIVQSTSIQPNATFQVKDTTSNQTTLFIPRSNGGNYNPLDTAGAHEIVAYNAVSNTQSLAIVPHSSTTCGLRMSGAGTPYCEIGCGGAGADPSQRITFNNPANTLQMTYTNLGITTGALPATSGAAAAAFLPVTINGVNYKIPLNTV